jgi:hypothetical protein
MRWRLGRVSRLVVTAYLPSVGADTSRKMGLDKLSATGAPESSGSSLSRPVGLTGHAGNVPHTIHKPWRYLANEVVQSPCLIPHASTSAPSRSRSLRTCMSPRGVHSAQHGTKQRASASGIPDTAPRGTLALVTIGIVIFASRAGGCCAGNQRP